MKSVTQGNIKAAIISVRGTKWRSFFTMLGVIIGIVSVVSIVSIGEGVKHQINQQINQLGRDLITVRPGQLTGNANQAGGLNLLSGLSIHGALSRQDVHTVQSTPGVKVAVPLSIVSGSPKGEKGTDKHSLSIGATSDLPTVLNQQLAYGSFYDFNNGGQNIAVIGQNAAKRLFNEDVPLGRSFELRGQQFVVRGIFKQFDAAPLSVDANFNDAIFIPDTTAQLITSDSAPIYEVLVRPDNPDQTNQVADTIDHNLLKTHDGQNDFSVLKQQESLAATNKILNLLTRLIGGVAAISLLVGGIGIMNIMLVSVTERMHEVGIRKAIGATNQQILDQFVIEATVLSVVGGLIGVVVSFVIDIALRIFTDLQPVISWWVVLLAVGVSVAVGILFGAVPALKAARKDPIEALRNE
jgi:ABC-type antimicrobial peptide transport system permease subunit